MMHFKEGNHVYEIVTLLSFMGEYPVYSLGLFGNRRIYRRLVARLTEPQTFLNDETGERFTCRLLNISGKGALKGIRLCKNALPILEWVHPDAFRYYTDTFGEFNFSGERAHKERNYRVAEAVRMMRNAGVNVVPYTLPRLQNEIRVTDVPKAPIFYTAKDVKRIDRAEMSKTMYSRMVGAVFCDRNCYAVYNTRKSVMKWKGLGELKSKLSLQDVGRMNAGIIEVKSAILFGENGDVAIKTLLDKENNLHRDTRFDSVYPYIHYISMDEYGARLLRLLLIPNFKEKLLDLLFDPKTRSYDNGSFEYDAYMDGIFVLSHFDGDIARLIRFKQAVEMDHVQCEILCFPHQNRYVKQYIGELCQLKNLKLSIIEKEILQNEYF